MMHSIKISDIAVASPSKTALPAAALSAVRGGISTFPLPYGPGPTFPTYPRYPWGF